MTRQVPLSSIPKFEALRRGTQLGFRARSLCRRYAADDTQCTHSVSLSFVGAMLSKGENLVPALCENGAVRSIVAVLAGMVTAGMLTARASRPPNRCRARAASGVQLSRLHAGHRCRTSCSARTATTSATTHSASPTGAGWCSAARHADTNLAGSARPRCTASRTSWISARGKTATSLRRPTASS